LDSEQSNGSKVRAMPERIQPPIGTPEACIPKTKNSTNTYMIVIVSILFSIGLIAVCEVISGWLTWIMVFGTAVWAAIDSKKIKFKRYKSGLSGGPGLLFFVVAAFWLIFFPWYLTMRYKIMTGSAVLKDEIPKVAAS
jgi:hypothetical protein